MSDGIVFDIQRFCTRDGPGIRTTVFLKGCPLRCPWCHNPESRAPRPELFFSPALCIDCGRCEAACPRRGGRRLLAEPGRPGCARCQACAAACPARAIEAAGRRMSVAEVLAEAEKDRIFYEESGGGLTLSGGEPFAQPAFALALLRAAAEAGLDRAVETCGCVPWPALEAARPWVGLFLWDIKDTDPERHRRLTGAPLEPILENLRRLDAVGARTRLRSVLVGGVNDDPGHIEALARLFGELRHCEGVEPIACHGLGESKRERLGLPPPERAWSAPAAETLATARARLAELGVPQPE